MLTAARILALSRPLARLANRPRRDAGLTRAIYAYPAKFQALLPAALIAAFSEPGELVVDPWGGGGTVALEAAVLGRPSVSFDVNPLACLIARVRTTQVPRAEVLAALAVALAGGPPRAILDEEDAAVVGAAVAAEAAALAGAIDGLAPASGDVLRLALVQAVKTVGRRDFRGASLGAVFERAARRLADAVWRLPRPSGAVIRCGDNRDMGELPDGAAALVVGSPPYKDLAVEYGLLQLQRPALGKSRRSRAAFTLLGVPPVSKALLCGGRGAAYFARLPATLAEVARVLRPDGAAFIWTGFKTAADRRAFVTALEAARLVVVRKLAVTLSADRTASSRSLHHGRPSKLLRNDTLYCCVRV